MRVRDVKKEVLIRKKAAEVVVNYGIEGFSMKTLALHCSISVSTIYVYFKNKEDLLFQLIMQLRLEQLSDSIRGLEADMPFENGLTLQWQNRFNYFMLHPIDMQALERLKYTAQFKQTTPGLVQNIDPVLGRFIENAVTRGELAKMPFEVYWAIGFAPLYALIEFHIAGSSYGSSAFSISESIIKEGAKRAALALSGRL